MRLATDLQRGFTLLEIMVVMVIVAVLAAIATPNLFAGKSRGKDLEREAATLVARLAAAQDDAILYGDEYGLVFSEEGYRFVRWDPVAYRFIALSAERGWSLRRFGDEVKVSASADDGDPILVWPEKPAAKTDEPAADNSEDGPENEPDWQPSVFVLSSGEVTPFTALFSAGGSEETLELRIDPLGNRLPPPDEPGMAEPAAEADANAG